MMVKACSEVKALDTAPKAVEEPGNTGQRGLKLAWVCTKVQVWNTMNG